MHPRVPSLAFTGLNHYQKSPAKECTHRTQLSQRGLRYGPLTGALQGWSYKRISPLQEFWSHRSINTARLNSALRSLTLLRSSWRATHNVLRLPKRDETSCRIPFTAQLCLHSARKNDKILTGSMRVSYRWNLSSTPNMESWRTTRGSHHPGT